MVNQNLKLTLKLKSEVSNEKDPHDIVFALLDCAIEMQKKDRELKKREDPEKLNELKKKFGL